MNRTIKAALLISLVFAVVVGLWTIESRRQASRTPVPAPATPSPAAMPPPPAPVVPPDAAQPETPPAPPSRLEREVPLRPPPMVTQLPPPIVGGEPPLQPSVPQPGPPPPPAAERPPTVELQPLREPPPAPSSPDPVPVAPQPSPEGELAAVQRVLDRFRQMYDQLDASAATAIWPQADSRALARIFARLEQQELNFDGCVIAVSESAATAQCTGSLRYVPRVGSAAPRTERHAWTIQLERAGEAWQIVQVSAR